MSDISDILDLSDQGSCHGSRARWRSDKSGWSDISDLGLDMSNLG
jgi:hypothetical protein